MAEFTPAGNIDPNSFTTEELLKHIYRQLTEMNAKMEQREKDYSEAKRHQDKRIDENKEAIIELRTTINEKEKTFKTIITVLTVGVALFSLFMGIVGYIIK